ncbi:hypothetical protein C440_04833 [Haloferax mucosum ATCC BAA-1512]|uniref:Uncharacterized protein n=1 Tax=Haloferax mucosum ATCC BAA-1512 TaxID=662479 RepID=M0ILV7_9EURY|nr:hypothetical protein [Haloferax mucosum]ELZ96444.1 hypothetical protein C440_04833 [Haloferax mucosum ATCC BAA-1512]
MVRRNLSDEEKERLDAIKEAENIGSDAQAVRVLINDAYDRLDDKATYDPLSERFTPLDTDEIRDILWRFDAPAINPDHLASWPRDRPDKKRVLAAICRYEGVSKKGGVRWQLKKHLGEGDPIVVRKAAGADNKDKRAPRNIHYYLADVVDMLDEHPPEDADNLPEGYNEDYDGILADDEEYLVDTAEEWIENTRKAMSRDDLPAGPFRGKLNFLDRLVNEAPEHHPGAKRLEDFRSELVAHIEELEADDGGDEQENKDDDTEELAEWDVLEAAESGGDEE